MSSRIVHLAWVLIVFAALLGGCGGGSSGARASDQTTSSATGGTGTGGNIAGGTGDTTGGTPTGGGTIVTGTPAPTPTTSGGTSTGGKHFTGKISDETGNGLKGVALEAQPVTAKGKVASAAAPRPVTTSSELGKEGEFDMDGINQDQLYQLTVSKENRKTLRTQFKIDPDSKDTSIYLISPKGTGTVEFVMPERMTLKATSKAGSKVDVNWYYKGENKDEKHGSPNSGFSSYTLLRAESPDQGARASEVKSFQTAFKLDYVDGNESPLTPKKYYYRLYEKVLLAELGTFALVGSNEVPVNFPGVETRSPEGTDISSAESISVEFSYPMKQSTVILKVTTDKGETITGEPTWNGNRITFSPKPGLKLARHTTVKIIGAQDDDGNIMDDYSWTFQTIYPRAELVTPNVGSPAVRTGSSIQVSLSPEIDKSSVENHLTVKSNLNETIDGQKSWTGSTLTFTPSSKMKLARVVTVSLTGAADADGNTVDGTGGTSSWSFTVANGYASSNWLQSGTYPFTNVACDPTGVILTAYVINDVGGGNLWLTGYKNEVWDGTYSRRHAQASNLDCVDREGQIWIGGYKGTPDVSGTILSKWGDGVTPAGEVLHTYSVKSNYPAYSVPVQAVDLSARTTGRTGIAYAPAGSAEFPSLGPPLNLAQGAINILQGDIASGFVAASSPQILDTTLDNAYPPGSRGSVGVTNEEATYLSASSVATDAAGNIYVADSVGGKVVVFQRDATKAHTGDSKYAYLTMWGHSGNGTFGTFTTSMSQIIVDDDNYVYVSDGGSSLVQKFAGVGVTGHNPGDFITQFPVGFIDTSPGKLGTKMCVDRTSGKLYSIADASTVIRRTAPVTDP